MSLDPQLGSSSAENAVGIWANSKLSMSHPKHPGLSREIERRDYPCPSSTLCPSSHGSSVQERHSQMGTNARLPTRLGLEHWPYEERLKV